jgi:hypothetical protein
MSTMTYDTAATARSAAPGAAPAVASKRKGLFARMIARIAEARQRQAMEEIRRYGIELPRELEDAGWKRGRSEDSLPFVR